MNFAPASEKKSSGRPAIEFDRLVKTFGSTTAVDKVSFKVFPGEVLSLIHI